MITEKQIKNLKPGDPLTIRGTFEKMMVGGYACVKFPVTLYDSSDNNYTKYVHPSAVSIIEPTYDSYRKFKKGDVVRVVECGGRLPTCHAPVMLGNTYTVSSDERKSGTILLDSPNGAVEWCYLELVTPVEDTLPYYIVEKDIEFQVHMRIKNEDCLISAFRFKNIVEGYKRYYDMLPSMKQAREAAEAECERLNAEYRKEHK